MCPVASIFESYVHRGAVCRLVAVNGEAPVTGNIYSPINLIVTLETPWRELTDVPFSDLRQPSGNHIAFAGYGGPVGFPGVTGPPGIACGPGPVGPEPSDVEEFKPPKLIVTCKVCGTRRPSIVPNDSLSKTQGDDCAASVGMKDGVWYVSGHYGSGKYDCMRFRFRCEPPDTFKDANPICNGCIEWLLLNRKIIEEVPGDYPWGLRD